MKTGTTGVKWIVEFYAFGSVTPSADDFSSAAGPDAIIGSSRSFATDIKNKINQNIPAASTTNGPEISYGIQSIRLKRDKFTPSGECNIVFVGRLPKYVYSGTWAIVYSVSAKDGSLLPRFIGQVYQTTHNFNHTGEGLLTSVHSIVLREWSTVLTAPVKYDTNSLQALALRSGSGALSLQGLANSVTDSAEASAKQIVDLLSGQFDPLKLAQIILQLIGCMNAEDLIQSSSAGDSNDVLSKLPSIALTAPSIPAGVLSRLKIHNNNFSLTALPGLKDTQNPYASGFVKTVTGVQGKAVSSAPNNNSWNGIFSSGGISEISETMMDGYESIPKPLSNGAEALTQLGIPAWNAITRFCDPTVFEYYTDIWYEKTPDGKEIKAQPVIVMRDKPFATKAALDYTDFKGSNSSIQKFTQYENLPRIHIPNEYIQSYSVRNSIANSPNYIVPAMQSPALKSELSQAIVTTQGIRRLEKEMRRFGGKAHDAETNFVGTEPTGALTAVGLSQNSDTFAQWVQLFADLQVIWHSFDYRTGSATLTIRDANFPVCVGFNLSFTIGKITLVGHIDSVGLDFTVNPEGLETTILQVQLSRVMEAKGDKLFFIDQNKWGNIPFEPSSTDSGALDSFDLPGFGSISGFGDF